MGHVEDLGEKFLGQAGEGVTAFKAYMNKGAFLRLGVPLGDQANARIIDHIPLYLGITKDLQNVEAHIPGPGRPNVSVSATFQGKVKLEHITSGFKFGVTPTITMSMKCILVLDLNVKTGIILEEPSKNGWVAIKPLNLTTNVYLNLTDCKADIALSGPCEFPGLSSVCDQLYPMLEARIENETQTRANIEIKKQDLNGMVTEALEQVIYVELTEWVLRIAANLGGSPNGTTLNVWIDDVAGALTGWYAYFGIMIFVTLVCQCTCCIVCIGKMCEACCGSKDENEAKSGDHPETVLKDARLAPGKMGKGHSEISM